MPLPLRPSPPSRPFAARLPGIWLRTALAGALASSLAACSLVAMQRLPADHRSGDPPECTSSWTNPLIDMGGAVTSGSAAVLLLGAASGEDNGGGSFRVTGWTTAGIAAVFIASGGYGAHQRNKCRSAVVAAERAHPGSTVPGIEEHTPLRGSEGAACKQDSDCGDDLLCDEPMKTCVRSADPPEATPPAAPADQPAGQPAADEPPPAEPPASPERPPSPAPSPAPGATTP